MPSIACCLACPTPALLQPTHHGGCRQRAVLAGHHSKQVVQLSGQASVAAGKRRAAAVGEQAGGSDEAGGRAAAGAPFDASSSSSPSTASHPCIAPQHAGTAPHPQCPGRSHQAAPHTHTHHAPDLQQQLRQSIFVKVRQHRAATLAQRPVSLQRRLHRTGRGEGRGEGRRLSKHPACSCFNWSAHPSQQHPHASQRGCPAAPAARSHLPCPPYRPPPPAPPTCRSWSRSAACSCTIRKRWLGCRLLRNSMAFMRSTCDATSAGDCATRSWACGCAAGGMGGGSQGRHGATPHGLPAQPLKRAGTQPLCRRTPRLPASHP